VVFCSPPIRCRLPSGPCAIAASVLIVSSVRFSFPRGRTLDSRRLFSVVLVSVSCNCSHILLRLSPLSPPVDDVALQSLLGCFPVRPDRFLRGSSLVNSPPELFSHHFSFVDLFPFLCIAFPSSYVFLFRILLCWRLPRVNKLVEAPLVFFLPSFPPLFFYLMFFFFSLSLQCFLFYFFLWVHFAPRLSFL